MKTTKKILILSLSVVLALYSCKKNDPAPKVSNLVVFDLQGKKDTVAAPYQVNYQMQDEVSNLFISGGSEEGAAFDLQIDKYRQEGGFVIGTHAFMHFRTAEPQATLYTFYEGDLFITSLPSTHITGTFSGKVIANGDYTDTGPAKTIDGTFSIDIPADPN